PNEAAVEQIRTSQARHIAKPPPTHGPLTAAMTGWGKSEIACGSAAIASWKCSRSIAGSDADTDGPKLRMSIPEQKPRPVPVRTTACADVSRAREPSAAVNSDSIAELIALSCFGLFRARTTTPARGRSMVSVSAIRVPAVSPAADRALAGR